MVDAIRSQEVFVEAVLAMRSGQDLGGMRDAFELQFGRNVSFQLFKYMYFLSTCCIAAEKHKFVETCVACQIMSLLK